MVGIWGQGGVWQVLMRASTGPRRRGTLVWQEAVDMGYGRSVAGAASSSRSSCTSRLAAHAAHVSLTLTTLSVPMSVQAGQLTRALLSSCSPTMCPPFPCLPSLPPLQDQAILETKVAPVLEGVADDEARVAALSGFMYTTQPPGGLPRGAMAVEVGGEEGEEGPGPARPGAGGQGRGAGRARAAGRGGRGRKGGR